MKLQNIFRRIFTDAYPDVPWKDFAGMRDFIVNNYFGVDVDAVCPAGLFQVR